MALTFVDIFKKTIWTIEEKEFAGLAKTEILSGFLYFIVILIVGSALQAIAIYVQSLNILAAILSTVMMTLTYAFGIGILLPLISHVLIKALGGNSTLAEVFCIYFYASTPSLLLTWLPCIGGLSPLVSFGNVFRGVREINRFPFWKPVIAVLLPSLIYWGLWIWAMFSLGFIRN